MAKADILTAAYTQGIVTKLGSADPVVREEGEKELAIQQAIMRGPDVTIAPASLTEAQAQGFPDRPAAAKYHEGLKIMANAQNAVAKEKGFFGELRSVMESYQKRSLLEKVGLGAAWSLCAAAAGTFGGPAGAYLAGINIVGQGARRIFGSLSTFYLMEALVNKTIFQKAMGFGQGPVSRFVKWGITIGSTAVAMFAGQALAETVTHGLTTVVNGVHDWVAGWVNPNKLGIVDKLLTPNPLPDWAPQPPGHQHLPDMGMPPHNPNGSMPIPTAPEELPNYSLENPSPSNRFNYDKPFFGRPEPGPVMAGLTNKAPSNGIAESLNKANDFLFGRSRGSTSV